MVDNIDIDDDTQPCPLQCTAVDRKGERQHEARVKDDKLAGDTLTALEANSVPGDDSNSQLGMKAHAMRAASLLWTVKGGTGCSREEASARRR